MKKFLSIPFLLLWSFTGLGQIPRLNLKKDSTYVLLIKQTTTTNQIIRQRPLETRMTLLARMSFKIAGIGKDDYKIYAKYDSINLNMDLPNGNLQYSSEHTDTTNVYSQLLARFKNKAFLVNLSRSGKMLFANEVDSYLSALSKLVKANPAQREQAFKQLQQSIGSNAVINMLDNLLYLSPASAVNKTDKWIIENTAPGEPPLVLRKFYAITHVSFTDLTIKGNGTVQSDTAIDTTQLNGMPVKRNLAGTSTSLITINKKTGWPKSAEVTQNLKGNLIIVDNPKLPGGLAIPVVITNNLVATSPSKE